MQFVIIGEDREDGLAARQKARPDHLDYWQGMETIFLSAGPFINELDQPVGSMIIIEAESLSKAEELAQADPYMLAGVFKSLSVKRWNWLFGKPKNES